MWGSIIAVLGTLLGSVTAYMLQQRTARTDRADARRHEERRDRIAAVTALTVALADHRRSMWVREDLRLSGASDADYQAARAASHNTRSALTAPLTTLAILAPDLAGVAQDAAGATYALRNTENRELLDSYREAAIEAADELVRAAATA
ncbi:MULTISPECIES: protein kilB [Streptomyces]|uniref:protein kilB n=1 Tax=Streptomyces TaxID=1883 RepID=UPI002056D749|nr:MULTISPECIES: protein kilB [Streptomyces]UPT44007.1 protein kilB [Streptomyces sp. WAC00303]WIY78181.1 protein kilB [Streptomyces anulatus]